MAQKREGVCLLTGEYGKLVKCHILPQALTRPSKKGAPLLQSTKGQGHKKRWSSWYDPSIVTRAGEDILGEIDDLAIKELRRSKLVWSGWGIAPPVFEKLHFISSDHGLRTVSDLDHSAIARFFLSIAWRASVSKLIDFEDFDLGSEIEADLKDCLLSTECRFDHYPISLTQLSTIGEIHNQSPYLDEKQLINPNGTESHKSLIVRIYVDGLIAHVHLNPLNHNPFEKTASHLGHCEDLLVLGITYERSFQYENMLTLAYESYFGPIGSDTARV